MESKSYGPKGGMGSAEAKAFYSSCEWGVHGTATFDINTGVLMCNRCKKEF